MADGYEQEHALFYKSIGDVSFTDVTVRTPGGPAMRVVESGALSLDDVRLEGTDGGPAVDATDVDEVRVRGCATPESDPFLRARGRDGLVSLAGNYAGLHEAVEVTDDVTLDDR